MVEAADHTKFNRSGMVHPAPFDDVDVVVTDRGLEPAWHEPLRSQGIEVILA